jgi:hypothetical protein
MLSGQGQFPFTLGYAPDPENPGWGVATFTATDHTMFGFGIADEKHFPELLVSLATGLQDNLPEQPATWGQALPPCPGDSHPAQAVVHLETAWWSCPKGGRLLSPIGQLSQVIGDSITDESV